MTDLIQRMGDWKLEEKNVAVRLSKAIQWPFEHVLYRFGIPGASTVARAACRITSNETAVVSNGTGARFGFPAWDSYYGHYLYSDRPYEPEIVALLAAHAANNEASFLDCGANYGYWSVLAASVLREAVVAIELNPTTMEHLRRNTQMASRSIEVLNAAVWSEDGVSMGINTTGPNQSHSAEVVEAKSGAPVPALAAMEVLSRSIDSIVREFSLRPDHLLVKIDCEGAEVMALAGAMESAKHGACFVLEDHGSDPTCSVSMRLFDLGWNVAIFDESKNQWNEVSSIDSVKQMKTDPVRGYNVLSWFGTLQPALSAVLPHQ
jgi:FkbM family methyltransferase